MTREELEHLIRASADIKIGQRVWVLGYPDRALAKVQAARAQAHAVGEPQNLCVAEAVPSLVRMMRREPESHVLAWRKDDERVPHTIADGPKQTL